MNLRSLLMTIFFLFLMITENANCMCVTKPVGLNEVLQQAYVSTLSQSFSMTSGISNTNNVAGETTRTVKTEQTSTTLHNNIVYSTNTLTPTFPLTTTSIPIMISTTPLADTFITCRLHFGKTSQYGKSDVLSPTFFIFNIELKSIIVYSGSILDAILFNFENGQSRLYGNPEDNDVKLSTRIDLKLKKIVGVNLRVASSISSIQFLLLDAIDQTYSWTKELGGQNGILYSINYNIIAPMSTLFSITSFSGTFSSERILSFSIGYTYKTCDSIKHTVQKTLPPLPSIITSISMAIKNTEASINEVTEHTETVNIYAIGNIEDTQ